MLSRLASLSNCCSLFSREYFFFSFSQKAPSKMKTDKYFRYFSSKRLAKTSFLHIIITKSIFSHRLIITHASFRKFMVKPIEKSHKERQSLKKMVQYIFLV